MKPLTKTFNRPWLWLPASISHDLAPIALPLVSFFYQEKKEKNQWRERKWRHLSFRKPVGIAGGVDKNGTTISSWWRLGAGFIEVGTVTPKPQHPNPPPIIDRSNSNEALWNKMGFPNLGMESLRKKLSSLPKKRPTPIFVNIGKNRNTDNTDASSDYVKCFEELKNYADAFVINISSPNTKNLRELQKTDSLKKLLNDIQSHNQKLPSPVPLLLKISPDTTESSLSQIIETSIECNIDGWILCNTTCQRPKDIHFPEEGGLSGKPLAPIAKKKLKSFLTILGNRKQDRLVISTGGVSTKQDIIERLDMGADLVQAYSALIFQGPLFFQQLND